MPAPIALTAPLPYPSPLSETPTVQEVIEQIFSVYDLLDQCNADRAAVRALTVPRGTH